MLKRLPPSLVDTCVANAARSPLARSETIYPSWYHQRWHFLPEGYLSRRGAAVYDHVVRPLYYSLGERSVLAVVAGWLKGIQPAAVAELGCGPGRALEAIAVALPGASVTGFDLSPFMLERAHRRTGGLANVTLAHADVAGPSLPSEAFDAVVALHVTGHVPLPAGRALLANAVQALRPGGRLIMADHRWHPNLHQYPLQIARRIRVATHLRLVELVRDPASPSPGRPSGRF